MRGAAHAHRGWVNVGNAAANRGAEEPIFAAGTQQCGVEAAKKREVPLILNGRHSAHDIMGSQKDTVLLVPSGEA